VSTRRPTSSRWRDHAYYNSRHWYFLRVGYDEREGRIVDVLSSDPAGSPAGPAVPHDGPVRLRLDLDGATLRASYGEVEWDRSTRASSPTSTPRSPAAACRGRGLHRRFFGLWVLDMTGGGLPADFSAPSKGTA